MMDEKKEFEIRRDVDHGIKMFLFEPNEKETHEAIKVVIQDILEAREDVKDYEIYVGMDEVEHEKAHINMMIDGKEISMSLG
jgi:hypothetical protein